MIKARQENKKRAGNKKRELDDFLFDSDDNFYFIAGYTSGGCSYGIMWEESVDLELENQIEYE